MKVSRKYWQIAQRLTTEQLRRRAHVSGELGDDLFYNLNINARGNTLFLGYYSREGLELVFHKYGIYENFKALGFSEIQFLIDTSDLYTHRLMVYNQTQTKENMLVELVLKKEFFVIDMPFASALNGQKFEGLAIEWLRMQNPSASFTKHRLRLPGQEYPGLGMASQLVELLIIASWRLKLAGLINTPDHYHNALFYSKVFYYLQPEDQARLMALQRDLKEYPTGKASWAVETGAVKDLRTNTILKWQPARQLIPLLDATKALFQKEDYQKCVRSLMKNFKFKLDEQLYREKMEKQEKQ